ncbi:unnamed protein product, partial [Ectocarpus sp. 13 AM-2016]
MFPACIYLQKINDYFGPRSGGSSVCLLSYMPLSPTHIYDSDKISCMCMLCGNRPGFGVAAGCGSLTGSFIVRNVSCARSRRKGRIRVSSGPELSSAYKQVSRLFKTKEASLGGLFGVLDQRAFWSQSLE